MAAIRVPGWCLRHCYYCSRRRMGQVEFQSGIRIGRGLAGEAAWLWADVVCYSFIVVDLHHLLLPDSRRTPPSPRWPG
jgi:hypothetical protein